MADLDTPPNLGHWHKPDHTTPSTYAGVPTCCANAADKAVMRAVERERLVARHAVIAERRRVLNLATEALRRYARISAYDAASAGVDRALIAVTTATVDECLRLVRDAACVCPTVELVADGGRVRAVTGFDAGCGTHDRDAA